MKIRGFTKFISLLVMAVLLVSLLLPLVPAKPVYADDPIPMNQIIFGGINDALNAAAAESNLLMGGHTWTAGPTGAVVSTPGTFSDLKFQLSEAPGAGKSYFFRLMKNNLNTAVSLTIADAATTGTSTGTVDVVAGDTVRLYAVPSGSPSTPIARWSIKFISPTKASLVMGGATTDPAATTFIAVSGHTTSVAAAAWLVQQVIPTAGKLKNLFGTLTVNPGASPKGYELALYKNTDDGAGKTALLITIGSSLAASNTVDEVSVAAGDIVWMRCTPLNSPDAAAVFRFGMTFVPDVHGESLVMGTTNDVPTIGATEYHYLQTGNYSPVWSGTETGFYQNGEVTKLRKLFVYLSGAPGADKSYVLTLRKNAGDTALAVTITGAVATTGTDTVDTVDIAAYDNLNVSVATTAGASSRYVRWSMVNYTTYAPIVISVYGGGAKTTAAMFGNITDTGGVAVTTRGFQYGLTNAYGSDINEVGLFSTGIYSAPLSGLTDNTLYYFRAYATNEIGTVYGSETTFKTAIWEGDYYNAAISSTGILSVTDPTTHAPLASLGKFNSNYGVAAVADTPPLNPSFEDVLDVNPANWYSSPGVQVTNANVIRTNTQASVGTYSMRVDVHTNGSAINVMSSAIPMVHGRTYKFTLDSRQTGAASGGWVNLYQYTDTAGTAGTLSFPGMPMISSTLNQWKEWSHYYTPPPDVKSVRYRIYVPYVNNSVVFFDNVVVKETNPTYQTNTATCTVTQTPSGANMLVSVSDNTNASVKMDYSYNLVATNPTLRYSTTVTYKADVSVEEDRFDIDIYDQSASVLTRDYQYQTFDVLKSYYFENTTSKHVKFTNGVNFTGNDNYQSGTLYATGGLTRFSLHGDWYYNHPFTVHPEGGYTGTWLSGIDKSRNEFPSGYTYSNAVSIVVNTTAATPALIKTRLPYGYDALLVFTNHADMETIDSLNAVFYGHSDVNHMDYGKKGLVGRGLVASLSAWAAPSAPQHPVDLIDPAAVALRLKLYNDGCEIGPHTIKNEVDIPEFVADNLPTYQTLFNSRLWIDHGLPSNYEDLAISGSVVGDDDYILDLLYQYNYSYTWHSSDMNFQGNDINTMYPAGTYYTRPLVYYNTHLDPDVTDNKRLYTFNSSAKPANYQTTIAPGAINTLISQRGVALEHSYLAAVPDGLNETYIVDGAHLAVDPTFDANLAHIQTKIASGELLVATISQAGDYWLQLQNVSVTNNVDGTFTVTNNGTSTVTGVTLLAESAIRSVSVNGLRVLSFGGKYGANELVLPPIAAGAAQTVTINYGVKDSSLYAVSSPTLNAISSTFNVRTRSLSFIADGIGTVTFNVEGLRTGTLYNIRRDGVLMGPVLSDGSGTLTFSALLGSEHEFRITTAVSESTASIIPTIFGVSLVILLVTGLALAVTRDYRIVVVVAVAGILGMIGIALLQGIINF